MSKRINSVQHARTTAANSKAANQIAEAQAVVPGVSDVNSNPFVQAAKKVPAGKQIKVDHKAQDDADAATAHKNAQADAANDAAPNNSTAVESTATGSAHMMMTALDTADQASGGTAPSSATPASDSGHHDSTPIILGVGALAIGGAVAALAGGGSSTPTTPVVTNHPPTFASGTGTATVAENTAITTTVLTATATDTDAGDTITYTLGGTDAASFAVSATGAVTFKASPNFEAKSSYSFSVIATDKAGLAATQTETVTITNVNEAPTFANPTGSGTVAENTPITTTVLTATATDVDAGDTLTYSLTGTDAAAFAVSATGVVTFKAIPDFEAKSSYSFNVVATDKAGLTATQAETVTVTNVNEAPVITSGSTTPPIAENSATSTVVYQATATDPENNPITFSLGGADAAAFNISASGAVTLKASPDFETKPSYSFTVIATDNANPALSSSQALTLGITNVNEAPQLGDPTATATAIAENGTTGATVFSAPAKGGDPDAGDTVTFALTGTDAGLFDVSNAGVVSFKAGVAANYEANASHSYSFILTAKDAAGLTDTQTVTVPITNVIDNLSLDQGNFSTPTVVTINANGVAGTDVGNVDYRFTETPGTQSNIVINNFSTNDFIQFTGADPVDYDYAVSGTDLTLTFTAPGNVLSKIVLTNAVNAGASVNSEATAETALTAHLGATTNVGGYLVGNAAPVSVSDEGLPNAQTTGATYNASGAAVTFTDDGNVASNVLIQNFRADDHINLTNVGPTGNLGSGVLFSNAPSDPAHDIQIDFFVNGQHTQIILDNVNPTGQGVNDLATATAVLGANFITFA